MPRIPQIPRSYFQFRLRTVLIAVTVFCVAFAWLASRFRPPPDPSFLAPEGVELRAQVDTKTYRIGDPIRLELELKNNSKSSYKLIMPRMPSGWWSTMAFGIRLTRGKSGVANLEPSDFYIGSYSGPPDFQTLAPGESFKSDICLQYFLPQGRKLPLPEGDYQLWIAFDSTKFAGVNPKGTEIACRFDANPIAFSIKGAARTDPEELLRLIGEKVGLNSLRVDLASSNRAEQDQAWQAVVKYGDSRLVPFLQGSTLPSVQRLYSRGQLEPYVQPYDPLSRW